MTLDEAIKTNENLLVDERANLLETEYDAIKLGIEALKAELKVRRQNPRMTFPRLPGENHFP